MTKDLQFLVEIVKQAGDLITDDFVVRAKDKNNDLITNFDFEIEKFLIEKLKEKYPKFSIISEEFNTDVKETANYFTIDPIDGTINFAHNLPLWGIQVAMIKNHETCASVLFLPRFDEIYYADKTGAYQNGRKLDLTKVKQFSQPLIDQIYLKNEEAFNKEFAKDVPSKYIARIFRKFYCSACSYSWLASGRLGAFVFAKSLPWDYMPGMYLVKQAKGANGVLKHGDEEYLVAAANKEILDEVLDVIKKTQ